MSFSGGEGNNKESCTEVNWPHDIIARQWRLNSSSDFRAYYWQDFCSSLICLLLFPDINCSNWGLEKSWQEWQDVLFWKRPMFWDSWHSECLWISAEVTHHKYRCRSILEKAIKRAKRRHASELAAKIKENMKKLCRYFQCKIIARERITWQSAWQSGWQCWWEVVLAARPGS